MTYLYSFLFCGLICLVGQIILDNTKLSPGHITSMFVVIGTFLDIFTDIANTVASILENIVNFVTFGLYGRARDSKFGQWLFPSVDEIIDNVNKYSPRSAMSSTARNMSYITNKSSTITNAPQVTVFTTADTLRDIYNLPYLRQVSLQL